MALNFSGLQTRRVADYSGEIVIFTLGWWACFVLYPMWYVPSPAARWPVGGALLLLCVVVGALFRYLVSYPYPQKEAQPEVPNDRFFFLALFFVATACHWPFLDQPILTGLDTIDHAAVPGVVADKIRDVIPLGRGVFWALAAFVLLNLFINHVPFRKAVVSLFQRICDGLAQNYFFFVLGLAGISIGYIAFVNHHSIPDRFGDITTIFRYPPLSKLIFIPVHAIFGMYDFVGQGIQLVFNFAGAVYMYRIACLFAGRDAGRLAAVFFVFLPPLFHYAHTHMIDSGTLFFVAASFYYALHYIETKSPRSLIYTALFTTFGFLYKHPVVSVVPGFALMLAYDTFFPRKMRLRPAIVPGIVACLIPTLTVYTFMKFSDLNPDTPDDVGSPSLIRFAANLAAIPQGVTWPVALLFLGGLVAMALRPERRPLWLLLCWIGTHYFISCLSKIYFNVRQSLPYYLGLVIVAAMAVDWLLREYPKTRKAFVGAIVPLYLIWACLLWPHEMDYRKLGKAFGDRSYINLTNWDDTYIPYDTIVRDLKIRTQPGELIYAPMANEPVMFYLAKHDFNDRRYIRDLELWPPRNTQTLEGLLQTLTQLKANYFLLPRGRWLYRYVDLQVVEALFENPPEWLEPVTVYTYGDVQVGLWRVTSDE